MIAIMDYDRMKTMDENVKWMTLTHLLSIFYVNLIAPVVHIPLLHII